jgi:hypothetical protein
MVCTHATSPTALASTWLSELLFPLFFRTDGFILPQSAKAIRPQEMKHLRLLASHPRVRLTPGTSVPRGAPPVLPPIDGRGPVVNASNSVRSIPFCLQKAIKPELQP